MIQIGNKAICEYCFKETDREPCPYCGFSRKEYVKDPMVLAVGNVLENRYIVGGVIGKGGFGITYLAYDKKLERRVAVKEYYPYGLAMRSLGSTFVSTVGGESEEVFKGGADKFYDEARLIAKFNDNPNIVSVHDFFYENDTVYFIMGFLKGQTLKCYIRDHGALTVGQTVQVARSVANALLAVHRLNVLHRDITPDNIMVCSDGTIKLLDFGAARQMLTKGSQSLSVILKPGFAPIEQYQKKGNQGPWTDIYALGATMYYALTLDLLDDPMSRLEDDSEYSLNAHSIDESLWEVIHKATMLKASERYRDIQDFLEALEALPVRPESLTISEDSVDRVKFEPVAQASHRLSGVASALQEESVGMTMPLVEEAAGVISALQEESVGMTMPLVEEAAGAISALQEESVGMTVPLVEEAAGVISALQEESVGMTMPLVEEAAGAISALQEESVGMTVPVSEEAAGVAQALQEEADAGQKSNTGMQTSDVEDQMPFSEEQPVGKKKIKRKLLRAIAAGAGVLTVLLLVWFVWFSTRDFRYKTYSDHVEITKYRGNDKAVEIPSEIGGKPVTEIGEDTFSDCEDLMSVTIPEHATIAENAFANFSDVSVIRYKAYSDHVEITKYSGSDKEVEIPSEIDGKPVTEIGVGAFSDCVTLKNVVIPDSVTSIGDAAFSYCVTLKNVVIPDSVTEIGNFAFNSCGSLERVIIPKHTTVAENAFANCYVIIIRMESTGNMTP